MKAAFVDRSSKFIRKKWYLLVLIMIGILSFGLNFYAISKVGYGNEYYAAAIKSMTQSFKNFFFVSFDPVGMNSVDKPPLGLWVQAIFVMIFGYHGWAMLLPQALAGTGSCIMLYILTSKYFGKAAGLLSSFIFALTPIVVVASRNNTMDMQLLFVLLVAAWFLFKSISSKKWRYLFIAAILIGLGFNIKMLQAYMVLPACAIVYLIFVQEKILKRFIAGIISILIVAVVSFAWVIAVDLYPSNNRPYVGSSTNNTEIELIVGHNGLERIYGQQGGSRGGPRSGNAPNGMMPQGNSQNGMPTPPSNENNMSIPNQQGTPPSQLNNQTAPTPPNGGTPPSSMNGKSDGNFVTHNDGQRRGMGDGHMGGNDIGSASLFRLFSNNLYGQSSWLIIMVLFAIIVSVRKINIRKLTLKQGIFTFWVLWFITMAVFFSFAGFYHRYYLCMMAPAIAVLSAIGVIQMAKDFQEKKSWRQFMLPVSLLAALGIEIVFVWNYTALRAWLVPIMAVAGIAAIIIMVIHYFKPQRLTLFTAISCMLVSILAAPFYWSLTPIMNPPNSTMPYAGPELASQGGPSNNSNKKFFNPGSSKTTGLEQYLVANYKKGSYLVVSQRASDVAKYIIDTGLPAVGYGGFLGSDNALTLDKLKALVKEGKISYFLVSGENRDSEIISYVKENATFINPSNYGGSSGQQGESSLYCFR